MKSWGYKKQNTGYLKRRFKRSGALEGIRIPDLQHSKIRSKFIKFLNIDVLST